MGKSSLVQAILGEMDKETGHVRVRMVMGVMGLVRGDVSLWHFSSHKSCSLGVCNVTSLY